DRRPHDGSSGAGLGRPGDLVAADHGRFRAARIRLLPAPWLDPGFHDGAGAGGAWCLHGAALLLLLPRPSDRARGLWIGIWMAWPPSHAGLGGGRGRPDRGGVGAPAQSRLERIPPELDRVPIWRSPKALPVS